MDGLKPCPFCGCEAKIYGNGYGMRFVECQVCGAASSMDFKSEGAVSLWNRRAERTCRFTKYPDAYPDEIGVGYCSECGEQMNDDYSYCPNCGAKVVE